MDMGMPPRPIALTRTSPMVRCCMVNPPLLPALPSGRATIRVRTVTPGPAARPGKLARVLTIDSAIVDAIVAHARRDHPDEACGVVAGPAGSDTPTRHIPMVNAARSMTFYEF